MNTLQPFFLGIPVQVEVAHAGLGEGVVVPVVHFQDAVHALQVEHYRARKPARGTAVRQVLAGRNRPQRNLYLLAMRTIC
jgi:hypothetical protein